MRSSDGQESMVVYNLTVRGDLGPVLRHALKPYVTASCVSQTVIRSSRTATVDLVGLLLALESRGLEVVDVRALA